MEYSIHFCIKIEAKTGSLTYYLASDSFPSEAYFEVKEEAKPGKRAVVYIPAEDVTSEEDVMYCNIMPGENETEIEVETGPGSMKSNRGEQLALKLIYFAILGSNMGTCQNCQHCQTNKLTLDTLHLITKHSLVDIPCR